MGKPAASRAAILTLVAQAQSLAPKRRPDDLPPTAVFPDVPDWHSHEWTIWELGEQAPQALVEAKSLLGDAAIYGAITQLIADTAAGRGPQSCVLLFGFVTCAPYAAHIADLLGDPDVAGHAVTALTKAKAKAAGYSDRVRPLLDAHQAWIRRTAQRYVDRYGTSPS
jgi:hypothetical protein